MKAVRLELFPKSTIDVFVNVIEEDGLSSAIANSTVAATCALIDAGIEMLGMVTSCSVALRGGVMLVDPTAKEEEGSDGVVSVSTMAAVGVTTSVCQTGDMNPIEVTRVSYPSMLKLVAELRFQCIETASARCLDIHRVIGQTMRQTRTIS